jgi:hypothetical protein
MAASLLPGWQDGTVATVEECRKALESLIARIANLDAADRAAHFPERTMSCRVPDLGLVFVTRVGPHGADPVTEAAPGEKPAQVRFTASSDDLVWIAGDPARFARAWLTGKLKVEASLFDVLRLRKFL